MPGKWAWIDPRPVLTASALVGCWVLPAGVARPGFVEFHAQYRLPMGSDGGGRVWGGGLLSPPGPADSAGTIRSAFFLPGGESAL